jgi:hypothetical protein
MTTSDGHSGSVDGPSGGSAQPMIERFPNGTKKSVRLAPCTFGEAVQLCAAEKWNGDQHGWVRERVRAFFAHPVSAAVKDQSIVAAEVHYGVRLDRMRLDGCTVEQALVFCELVVEFDPLADNHWLDDVMPEPTVFEVLEKYGWKD